MNSVLIEIKKLLGIPKEHDEFDVDVIAAINAAFASLSQIFKHDPYSISDVENTWDEYEVDTAQLGFVKQYIFLKTRLIFDPPQSSSVADIFGKQIAELEWRLNVSN